MLRNITFSVDEAIIAQAREAAKVEGTTLNELVRDWIRSYAGKNERRQKMEHAFEILKDLDTSGPKMTRDEMNERR
ncbi:MAG: hypothetical protein HYX27_23235 [Acidobacteria bacterium]|nr:hypothetical protein [Acidobacteriota bacterium]